MQDSQRHPGQKEALSRPSPTHRTARTPGLRDTASSLVLPGDMTEQPQGLGSIKDLVLLPRERGKCFGQLEAELRVKCVCSRVCGVCDGGRKGRPPGLGSVIGNWKWPKEVNSLSPLRVSPAGAAEDGSRWGGKAGFEVGRESRLPVPPCAALCRRVQAQQEPNSHLHN